MKVTFVKTQVNMKTYVQLLSIIFTILLSAKWAIGQKELNILTFNIRFDNPKDAPNDWPNRKDLVASQILFHEADIIGIQEALFNQLTDLKERLPGFEFVGKGRDDGKQAGEHSSIFFNTGRLELLATSTFWLSLTPEVPGSKSWDAAITRVVSWAKFKDKQTRKIFFVFNTHFDHIGKTARQESAKMIIKAVDSIAGKIPSILTGDFNSFPDDSPMQILTDEKNPNRLQNTKSLSITGHYGPEGTFNAFGPKETDNKPIDHIFVKGNWTVEKHATLSQTWGGKFSSDHFPVYVRLRMNK
jgi:endonuclease/exonuclease/phosphatase family metal-dependent hydrolase